MRTPSHWFVECTTALEAPALVAIVVTRRVKRVPTTATPITKTTTSATVSQRGLPTVATELATLVELVLVDAICRSSARGSAGNEMQG